MSGASATDDPGRDPLSNDRGDRAPGEDLDNKSLGGEIGGYALGLLLAAGLTAMSFWLPTSGLVWKPSVPAALIVFAIAQMGVHLAFFLHITTGPDNTNNVIALAFGVFIVLIVVVGSVWIMGHLSHQAMTAEQMLRMQR